MLYCIFERICVSFTITAESRSDLIFVLHLRQKINIFVCSFFLFIIILDQVYIPVINSDGSRVF